MKNVFNIIFFSLALISCKTLNIYNVDAKEGALEELINDSKDFYSTISVDDKVSVSVWGHEGMSVGSVFGIYNSNEVFGKWLIVSPDSVLTLPKLGRIKVVGLKLDELKDVLTKKYGKFILNPIVDVKIHNHEVTIIGQVIKPGNYSIYKGHNSVAYLIGAAGGTDYYAKLQRVNLVRGEDNYILDLTEMNPLAMDRSTLKPGDVLYFPTKKGKVLDKKSSTLLIVSSIFTTFLLLLTRDK